MRFKVISIIGILLCCNVFLVKSQVRCDHDSIIMSFLNKISTIDYYPSIDDYNLYFDSHTEIEIGLRIEYENDFPDSVNSNRVNNISFSIEHLLKDNTVKNMINKHNENKNCDWEIVNQYEKGTASIIYEVGLNCSSTTIKFQMVNWAYKDRCGIYDILQSDGKSIFSSQ